MTHEGSRMGRTETDIRKLCPKSQVPDGLPVRGGAVGSSKETVRRWVRGARVRQIANKNASDISEAFLIYPQM